MHYRTRAYTWDEFDCLHGIFLVLGFGRQLLHEKKLRLDYFYATIHCQQRNGLYENLI
jgi:hypothetical protein